jgi:hypothetical protein
VLVKNLALKADAGYGRTQSPTMNTSDLPTTFKLGTSPVRSYELGLFYATSREAYVGVDGYWTHYSYGRSPVYPVSFGGMSGTVVEPTSKTTRDGVQLMFGYAY